MRLRAASKPALKTTGCMWITLPDSVERASGSAVQPRTHAHAVGAHQPRSSFWHTKRTRAATARSMDHAGTLARWHAGTLAHSRADTAQAGATRVGHGVANSSGSYSGVR